MQEMNESAAVPKLGLVWHWEFTQRRQKKKKTWGAAYLLTKMAKNECEKTVWINDTVELLLQVTSESKASKLHDEVY